MTDFILARGPDARLEQPTAETNMAALLDQPTDPAATSPWPTVHRPPLEPGIDVDPRPTVPFTPLQRLGTTVESKARRRLPRRWQRYRWPELGALVVLLLGMTAIVGLLLLSGIRHFGDPSDCYVTHTVTADQHTVQQVAAFEGAYSATAIRKWSQIIMDLNGLTTNQLTVGQKVVVPAQPRQCVH